jgi:hypothetical protein
LRSAYARFAAIIFAVIALLRLTRLVSGWSITLSDGDSGVEKLDLCVVAGVSAWLGFGASR